MKELTIEQKAQAYDEAIDRANELLYVSDKESLQYQTIKHILPELIESEDEKIINFISNELACLRATEGKGSDRYEELTNAISWLENQCEQKPIDKVELKFKVGDWVVFNNKHQSIYQVEKIEDGYYILRHTHGGTFRVCVLHSESLRLWTIQDAKDGDVLTFKNNICGTIICKSPTYYGTRSYCRLLRGNFINKEESGLDSTLLVPATKEQRDSLMKAIEDSGYTFDFKKKELKKIEKQLCESIQETKPNGGIICEDFNDGDGYYKVNLTYLSKSQVELIENLVTSWQNLTNSVTNLNEEKKRLHDIQNVPVDEDKLKRDRSNTL